MADIIHKNRLNHWNKSVGKNIKYYRKSLFITQHQVATHLNLEKSTISLYEAGKVNIPAKYLYAISLILNIDIPAFFAHPEEKFKELSSNKSRVSGKQARALQQKI